MSTPSRDAGVRALPAGLIVSCQARVGHPLRHPEMMAAMAVAAQLAGAVGIRAAGAEDITAIRGLVDLPIVGLTKRVRVDSPVIITATIEEATEVAAAGADVIAVDVTQRPRPNGLSGAALIGAIHDRLGKAVLADTDSVASARAAVAAGADAVATTLAGYTQGAVPDGPDLRLLAELVDTMDVPVVGEGRFWHPEEVAEALRLGAHAVVVGTAITDPVAIAERFVRASRTVGR